jgi:Protein of unknown function (DUF2924)
LEELNLRSCAFSINTTEGFWSISKCSVVGRYHKVPQKSLPPWVPATAASPSPNLCFVFLSIAHSSESPEKVGQRAVDLSRHNADLRPGTVLGREWNGQMQQVAVLADSFAWNGKTYPSLSNVAFAITGTRWNGPKFFGLRDKPSKGSSP